MKRAIFTVLSVSSTIFCGYLATSDAAPKPIEPMNPPSLLDLTEKWAKINGVPTVLVQAIISHESRGDSFCEVAEPNGTISRGLMGINSIHIKPNKIHYSQLFSPDKNIEIGTKILSNCYRYARKTLGNRADEKSLVKTALGCYNGDRTGRYYEKVMAKIGEEFFS